MNRLIRLLICVAFIIFAHPAKAQDELTRALDKDSKRDTKAYAIRSLEGNRSIIHIMPDYVRHMLKISCLKDTITLDDYWDVPAEITHMDDSFLCLKYDVRGGSNLALGNILILCVSHNKLYEALHVLRYSHWEAFDIKRYDVELFLKKTTANYELTAQVRDKVISQTEPETNYRFTNTTKLQFDAKEKIFYSIKENLDDTIKVSYPATGLTYKREIIGNFPTVLLGKEEYYFIGNQWFEFWRNTLTKY